MQMTIKGCCYKLDKMYLSGNSAKLTKRNCFKYNLYRTQSCKFTTNGLIFDLYWKSLRACHFCKRLLVKVLVNDILNWFEM